MVDFNAPVINELTVFNVDNLMADTTYRVSASFDDGFPPSETLETLVSTPLEPVAQGFIIDDEELPDELDGSVPLGITHVNGVTDVLLRSTPRAGRRWFGIATYDRSGEFTGQSTWINDPSNQFLPADGSVRTFYRFREDQPDTPWPARWLFYGRRGAVWQPPTQQAMDQGRLHEGRLQDSFFVDRWSDAQFAARVDVPAIYYRPRNNNPKLGWAPATDSAPEGISYVTVDVGGIRLRDVRDNIITTIMLDGQNRNPVDCVMVGSRILVADSAGRRIFSYRLTGGTGITLGGPQLARIRVNDRILYTTGLPGPFDVTLNPLQSDLLRTPHFSISGFSENPDDVIDIDGSGQPQAPGSWPTTDPFLPPGTVLESRHTIVVSRPHQGLAEAEYILNVNGVVGRQVPPPPPPEVLPPGIDPPGFEQPPNLIFRVAPASAFVGGGTNLEWISAGADTVVVTGPGGEVLSRDLNGRVSVGPYDTVGTRTFTALATNVHGVTTRTGDFRVAPLPPPSDDILSFSGSPSSGPAGTEVTLSWSTSEGSFARLNGQVVSSPGSTTVTPQETTTYTLTTDDDSASWTFTVSEEEEVLEPITWDVPPSGGEIESGQSHTFSWATSNATQVTLNGESVSVDGSATVSPTQTTLYTFVASAPNLESVTVTVEVIVTGDDVPPIIVPPERVLEWVTRPSGGTINAGESFTISFAVNNGLAAAVGGVAVTLAAGAGSRTVSPTVTTAYTVAVSGPLRQSLSETVTVTVRGTPDLPTEAVIPQFDTVSPSVNIDEGDSTTITWTTTRADYVTVNGVQYGADDSLTVSPTSTTIYVLRAFSSTGNSVAAYVTVSVTSTVELELTFDVSPDSAAPGDVVALRWRSSGASYVVLNIAGTSTRHNPNGDLSYTVPSSAEEGDTISLSATAVGPSGSKSVPASISVETRERVTVTLTSSVATVIQCDSLQLAWTSQNAIAVSISTVGPVSPASAGSVTVTPAQSGTYIATAVGAGGESTTARVTVTVIPLPSVSTRFSGNTQVASLPAFQLSLTVSADAALLATIQPPTPRQLYIRLDGPNLINPLGQARQFLNWTIPAALVSSGPVTRVGSINQSGTQPSGTWTVTVSLGGAGGRVVASGSITA